MGCPVKGTGLSQASDTLTSGFAPAYTLLRQSTGAGPTPLAHRHGPRTGRTASPRINHQVVLLDLGGAAAGAAQAEHSLIPATGTGAAVRGACGAAAGRRGACRELLQHRKEVVE